jgi:anti-sigma regulatory factor (Ser/Thr protein kinase)
MSPHVSEPRRAKRRSGRVSGNTLSLVLPGGPYAASEARSALGVLGREFQPDLLAGLRLLVSELVTNSIEHGQAGPDDAIRIEVAISNGCVRAEVADLGPGFEPRWPLPDPRDNGGSGGWGLVILDRVASRWGTDERGRRVWFELEANGGPTRSGDLID